MSLAATKDDLQDIVIDEVFPHAPAKLWKVLTDGALMARWLMEPLGFEPVVGKHFTFKTTPAGEWDGTIECQVLEVVPEERIAFSWKGGHESNVGYGSRLETRVTWTLTETAGVSGVHDVRTRKMGDMIVVDVHIEVDAQLSVEAGHDIAVAARQRVLQRHRVLNLMTHLDPWHRPDLDHAISATSSVR